MSHIGDIICQSQNIAYAHEIKRISKRICASVHCNSIRTHSKRFEAFRNITPTHIINCIRKVPDRNIVDCRDACRVVVLPASLIEAAALVNYGTVSLLVHG